MTEDEMVGWHHQLNAHEFEQAHGDGEGQGSLACCSPWVAKSWTHLATEKQQQKNDSRYCAILQYYSRAQSCLTLCDLMNYNTPGLSIHHQLPEFTQTHVH